MSRTIMGALIFVLLLASVGVRGGGASVRAGEPAASAGPVLGPLSEITVTGRRGGSEPLAPTTRLDATALGALDATGAADLLRLVPAANIQTNSRGETLVFLRGAGERQVAVFFDGALLNVPWDNRIDLSLIPAAAIGRLSVVSGVTPVEYGANTIGGAVNIISPSAFDADAARTLEVAAGGAGRRDVDGRVAITAAGTGLILGAGYHRHGDVPLAAGADLPFNQRGTPRRSNTDSRFAQFYARAEHHPTGGTALAASVLVVEGEKGVAPEGHVPPEEARFWRYPDWRLRMAILSGDGDAWAGLRWKASTWVQSFAQTIDSFAGLDLARRRERQKDDDLTFGARLILGRDFAFGRLLYAFNGLVSTHHQKNLAFEDDAAAPLRLGFRQWTMSHGLEYEAALGRRLDVTLGTEVDLLAAPKTGDKPGIGDFAVWNVMAGARFALSPDWSLRAAVGRKTRLPTLRELFGTALNRFLVNPGLRPEAAVLIEAALEGRWSGGAIRFAPFATFVDDSIDQRNLVIDGRRLRQRINLAGSRTLGVEVGGVLDLGAGTSLDGHATYMNTRGRRDSSEAFTRLPEKPRLIARAALTHRTPWGLEGSLELVHRGRAFSLDAANGLVPLRVSTTLNLRLAYRLEQVLPGADGLELYFRIDNLNDQLVEPQAGLPGAGRWLSGGVKAAF